MTQKFLKAIICFIAILCMFCSFSTAFAENGDVDFDFNIQPLEPTTQAETVPVETEEETEKETQKQTEKETTEKPTKKPASTHTTKPKETQVSNDNANANYSSGQNANAFVEDDKPATEPETIEESTEEPLPEGSFYVYLERNNGQRRLKTVVVGENYLPEPEIPLRKGYAFAGWYQDSEYKKKWDFLRDKAKKEMVIYAKWVKDDSTIEHDIKIGEISGGKIEVNPQSACLGEPVVITVLPDEGKRLVQGSLKINGEATDFLSFVMPKGDVVITAKFEDVPEKTEDEEKPETVIFLVMGVAVVAVLVAIAVIAKKRYDFNADLDPDEDLQIDNEEYYDDWIDESIVVEDGFVEGKKVVENTEPDYGAPDLDEDDLD